MTITDRLYIWCDSLEVEIQLLGQSPAVHLYCVDPDLFGEYIMAEALLLREPLETAIYHFIAHRGWPALNSELTIYLQHRLVAARDLLLGGLASESPERWLLQCKPAAPDLSDEKATIQWLLIDAWNKIGPMHLELYAKNYLAKHPPPGS